MSANPVRVVKYEKQDGFVDIQLWRGGIIVEVEQMKQIAKAIEIFIEDTEIENEKSIKHVD